MEFVNRTYGLLLIYLLKSSFLGVVTLFIAGFCLGWFLVHFMRGVEVVASGQVEKRHGGWWRLLIAAAFLGLVLVPHGLPFVLEYWPIVVFGAGTGVLFCYSHLFTLGGVGIILSLAVFLLIVLGWTLKAFTGKTAILTVKVRSIEQQQEIPRLSLVVTDLKTNEVTTYYVNGNKWGLRANVVLFEDWVTFFGGKTYYRLNSVLGATDTALDQRLVDGFSEPLWEELEKNEDKLPGIRAVYEDIVLKEPMVGREYTIYIDNDGALVPELSSGSGNLNLVETDEDQ